MDDSDEEGQSLLSREQRESLARGKRMLQDTIRIGVFVSEAVHRDGQVIAGVRNKMSAINDHADEATGILARCNIAWVLGLTLFPSCVQRIESLRRWRTWWPILGLICVVASALVVWWMLHRLRSSARSHAASAAGASG